MLKVVFCVGQPSDGTMENGRQETPSPPPPTSVPPQRSGLVAGLGWVVAVIAVAVAVALTVWAQRAQRELRNQIASLQQAVTAARQVFLKRANDELGYASVDLEGSLPNRYQASFRINEALRWLQDAEPLLSQNGQRQLAALRQRLTQLTVTAEQDPTRAREELARARDALEHLIRAETQTQ